MARVAEAGGASGEIAQGPRLRLVELPADANVDREKGWLIAPGVETTLFRASSLPPTSGKLTGGAFLELP